MARAVEAKVKLTLVDGLTARLKGISARLSRLGKSLGLNRITAAFGDLGARIRGLGPAIGATSARLGSFVGLLGLGGGGAVAASIGLANSASALGDEIAKTSRQLGIGAEALQEYRYAAEMSGVSQSTLENAMKRFGINAADAAAGNKALATEFEKLGISVTDAQGNMRDMETVFDETVAAIASIESPMERSRAAMDLFGRSGVDMVRLFEIGTDGVRELREEARLTGHVMSEEAAEFGEVYGDNITRLTKRFDGLKIMIGVQLMPVINDFVVKLTEWYDANQDLIRSTLSEWVERLAGVLRDLTNPASELRQSMADLAGKVTGFVDAIKPAIEHVGYGNAAFIALGTYIAGPLLTAIAALAPAIGKLGVAFMTTPFGWITLGIVAVGAAVHVMIQQWDEFVAYWAGLWDRIMSAFDRSWTEGILVALQEFNPVVHIARGIDAVIAYFTGVSLLAEGEAMLRTFETGVVNVWNGLVEWVKIKVVEFAQLFNIDLFAIGQAVVDGLLNGIKAGWGNLTGWLSQSIADLTAMVPDFLKERLGIEVTQRVLTQEEIADRARGAGQEAASRVEGGGFLGMGADPDFEARRQAAAAEAEAAEIARLNIENARIRSQLEAAQASGGSGSLVQPVNVGAPAVNVQMPASIPTQTVEATSVEAGDVNAGNFVAPEPLLVHKPQAVDASLHVGQVVVNVPPGFTQAQAEALVNRTMQQHATERQAAALSALND